MVGWEITNLALGIFAILLGANFIVDSATKVAKSMNISGAFIGLTILSIGTSLPEIFTHIFSSIDILKGIETSGISVGTNIGSNIIQITFIMGLLGIVTVIKADKKILKTDYLVMLGSILALFFLSLDGRISRIEGVMLVSAYIFYIWFLAKNEKMIEKNPFKANYWKEGIIMIFGFIALAVAANSVVNSAITLSETWGISQSFIGTLIIGVSTALPEMTTALIAILRGAHGVSLGTLVGSNITNPLFSLGIGGIISGYTIADSIVFFDLPWWFFASLVPLFFFWKKDYLKKWEASAMMLIYVAYGLFRIKLFL